MHACMNHQKSLRRNIMWHRRSINATWSKRIKSGRKKLSAIVFSKSSSACWHTLSKLMKAEIFDLSNLVSTEVIIINAVDRVALCLRGTSSQVVTVRLIICDGFFMRINEIEWGGEKKKHSPEKIQAQFHRVNMWTAVVNSAYQAAKKHVSLSSLD